MKRIITGAVAVLLATATLQAQTDTTKNLRHERRDMQKEGPYARLNLSADQQAQLQSLRDEFKQKHEALKSEKLTEAERKSQFEALRAQRKAATDAILTPAQKEQLEKMKSERNGKMHGDKKSARDSSTTFNRGAGRDGMRGAGLQKELNLTAEQQAKLKTIRTDFKSKGDSVLNDQLLTAEQKREKLRDLAKQQQAEMKTVLTDEQQKKLQSLRTERSARNTR